MCRNGAVGGIDNVNGLVSAVAVKERVKERYREISRDESTQGEVHSTQNKFKAIQFPLRRSK